MFQNARERHDEEETEPFLRQSMQDVDQLSMSHYREMLIED